MLRPKSAHPLYKRSLQSLSSNNTARYSNRFIFSQSAFDDIYQPQSDKKCKVIAGPSLFYNAYTQKNYHNYYKQQRLNTAQSSSLRKSNKKTKPIKLRPSKPLSCRSLSTLKSQIVRIRQATEQIEEAIYVTQKTFYKKKNRVSTSQLYSQLTKSSGKNKKQSYKSMSSQITQQANKQNLKIAITHNTNLISGLGYENSLNSKIQARNSPDTAENSDNNSHPWNYIKFN